MVRERTGRRLVVEADGGARGNPGPAGYGAVVRDADTGEVLAEIAEAIGEATNNVAEYRGLIAGLRAAAGIDPGAEVEARLDSRLVVEQMSGRWGIKHENMRRLAGEARDVLPEDQVRYTWVPRERNTDADRLANEAMDEAAGRAPRRRVQATSRDDPADDDADAAPDPVPASRRTAPDTEPPTTLLLVRHGSTAWTAERRACGGDEPGPALSDPGLEEARRVTKLIASGEAAGAGSPPVAVVSSPMLRTRQTADVIAAGLGVSVHVDDDWAELSFGEWHGLTYAEILRGWRAEFDRWQGSMTATPPGGESLAQLTNRVAAARERMITRYPSQPVVVVTHVGPIRALVTGVLEAGAAAMWRLRVSPGSLTVVRCWADGAAEVAALNVGGGVPGAGAAGTV